MGYVVTAPLVVAHTENGDAYVFEGGELPENTDETQLKQLVASKMVTKAGKTAPAADADKPATVEEILAEVGDDPAKAQAALDAEVAEKGDKARKSLVEKLEAVISAAEGGQGS